MASGPHARQPKYLLGPQRASKVKSFFDQKKEEVKSFVLGHEAVFEAIQRHSTEIYETEYDGSEVNLVQHILRLVDEEMNASLMADFLRKISVRLFLVWVPLKHLDHMVSMVCSIKRFGNQLRRKSTERFWSFLDMEVCPWRSTRLL